MSEDPQPDKQEIMTESAVILFVFLQLLLFSSPSSSLPLCTDLRAPEVPESPLSFCQYNGSSCCDSSKDLQLQKQFQAMNILDLPCASLLKSILCSACDPFSAQLYKAETHQQRPVPVLCNSTARSGSYSSKQSTDTFCSKLWNTCKNIPISSSPFAPSLKGPPGGPSITSNTSTLTQLWQSEDNFCAVFGSSFSDNSQCFNGEPVSLNKTQLETGPDPKGLCLEKIDNGAYINMAPHPDGSNRAFFSNLPGKIWLAGISEQDSGKTLDLDESDPFVDLTDLVLFDTVFGMLGMAFHPNFEKNGRFFASYNCDRLKSPGCTGRCACNSDVNCDPSKINTTSLSQPCQYQSIIAEFSANGTASDPSLAKTAKPEEVRRIFTMGLPFRNNHGGQILFGPTDGYLYVMMGDGGGRDDPYNFAQNKKSVLGKILRLNVDNMPSQEQIADLGLWGNYSVPRDNPYTEDKELAHEIYAMGFRNPWRCSFDTDRPSYFLCADVGQVMIHKSRPRLFLLQMKVFYIHPCGVVSLLLFFSLQLYGDLYASHIWADTETPDNSGNFTTTEMPFTCAHDSPLPCQSVPGSTLPALGYIYSFGQDNNKDLYILTSTGVFRAVRPSRCNYSCSKEVLAPTRGPSSNPPAHSDGVRSVNCHLKEALLSIVCFLLLQLFVL